MALGWFTEQLEQRKRQDQQDFSESMERIAQAVLGDKSVESMLESEAQQDSKDDIDAVLRYFKLKPRPVPDSVQHFEEKLEYSMRPYGIMYRRVELKENWYRDAYGPMIGTLKENGATVALLPYGYSGYYRIDPDTGNKIRITRRNVGELDTTAVVFYRPLPQRRLKVPDLLRYMWQCVSMSDLAMLVGISLLVSVVGLLLPRIHMLLTGMIYESGRDDMLIGTAAFILATLITSSMIGISRSLMSNRLQNKTDLGMEAATMMRVLSLPAHFFRQFSSGELSSRLSSVNQLGMLIVGRILSVGVTSLASLVYVGQIFTIAPALALPSLGIVAATTLLTVVTTLRQVDYSRRLMEHEAKLDGMTYSMINGVQKIKLAGAEKRMFARWARMYAAGAKVEYNPTLLIRLSSAFSLAVTVVGNMVLYFLAVQSGVTPSQYIGFSAAFGAVSAAFRALADIAMTASTIQPTLEMAEPILKAEPETSEGREIITHLSGSIELNNVSFRYNSTMPYVVDNLSLKIRAGEYIALVGRTGCGKSTLVRLMLGFETPEKGGVFYDGKDINTLDLRSLRRKIGSVTQDGTLIPGDIYSNIVISAPELTLQEAWEAAEMSGIAEDIREMPMGMNTMIAEGQGGISGGQKQRLMIARAVAPKPRILIFDEATSALDNLTQKKVSEALDGLKCTRIVIAHRLSTIRHCDRILLMEDGRIAESGTYEELIAKGGKFAELVERQRLDTGDESD
ncbi:MAG: ATP-binding cassette domain-containing protein [Clostridia bacterium]|nr:ATP-binding cassette domain-containing protein [Clostridia bacterium]